MIRIPVITLYQPWASFVRDGLKPIETRTHNRFAKLVGKRIAIHAGKRYDASALNQAVQHHATSRCDATTFFQYTQRACTYGCILCTIRVLKHRRLRFNDRTDALCYAHGLFGLFLDPDSIVKFDPIPMRGNQGIWFANLPEYCVPENELKSLTTGS